MPLLRISSPNLCENIRKANIWGILIYSKCCKFVFVYRINSILLHFPCTEFYILAYLLFYLYFKTCTFKIYTQWFSKLFYNGVSSLQYSYLQFQYPALYPLLYWSHFPSLNLTDPLTGILKFYMYILFIHLFRVQFWQSWLTPDLLCIQGSLWVEFRGLYGVVEGRTICVQGKLLSNC